MRCHAHRGRQVGLDHLAGALAGAQQHLVDLLAAAATSACPAA
jgi:hypothetical protein